MIAIPRIKDYQSKNKEVVEEETSLTVEGIMAVEEDLETYVELIGNTYSNKTVPVFPSIPAEVVSIAVELGDFVNEGDVLFTLDGSNIETQVSQAELGVEQAQAAVSQANVGIKNADAAIASAQLAYDMAKSNYDMNISNYEFAVSNLEKYAQLYAEGIVSEMEYEQMKLQTSPETLTLLEKQLAQAAQGLKQAQLAKEQASSGYTQANVGVKQANLGLDTASDAVGDLVVTAPATGYITAQNLNEKVIASNASIAMTIDELQVIKVTTNVTANQVNGINIGDEVDVIISSNDKTYKGSVKSVGLTADARTMLYSVTILVENESLEIKPGMFATVRVINGVARGAVVVPSEAIVVRDGIDVVYVQEGDYPKKVAVKKGLDTGYFVEILEGIKSGDVVITKGVGLIDESTKIKVVRGDE